MNDTDLRPIDRVIAALRGLDKRVEQHGDKYMAQCPAHPDNDPSLSITEGDTVPVVLHCHGFCESSDVLAALGLSWADLCGDAPPEELHRAPPAGPADYVCRRLDGTEFAKVVRRSGHRFHQVHRVGEHWESGGCDELTVTPYRADEIAVAIAAARTIYVVEGERDTDTLWELGLPATCNAGGAGKWKPQHAEHLRGATVEIIRDRDEPGIRHAAAVQASLQGVAGPVRVLDPAPGCKDVTDHVSAGLTLADLVEVTVKAGRRLKAVSAATIRPRRQLWLWDHRIPIKALTLMAGREGVGKSTVMVAVAAELTRGELAGELFGVGASVLYLTSEDAREEIIVPRLIAAGAVLERVHFVDAFSDGARSRTVLPLDIERLEELIVRHRVALVVLDAATSVIDSRLDGNRDREMRQGLEPIVEMAQRTGCAVVGIVHFGKRDSGDTGKLILGSIAWSQVARSTLAVAADEEEQLVISATKRNLAPSGTANLKAVIRSAIVETDEGPADVGVVEWLGETDVSARDLLGGDEAAEQRTERVHAVAWLEEYLTVYARPRSAEVKKAARAEGIADRTLARARIKLGVRAEDEGYPRTTYWSLPPDSGATFGDEVRARGGGTTASTGPDLGIRGGTTGEPGYSTGTTGGTTGDTGSDQGKRDPDTSSDDGRATPHVHGTSDLACDVCGGPGVRFATPDGDVVGCIIHNPMLDAREAEAS